MSQDFLQQQQDFANQAGATTGQSNSAANALANGPVKKKSLSVKQLGLGLLLAALGGVFGYFVGMLGTEHLIKTVAVVLPNYDPGPVAAIGAIVTGVVFGLFLAILLHELGHLAGGMLAGFKFQLLIVGPLKLQRQGSQLVFGRNRITNAMSGLASCTPHPHSNLRKGMLQMIVGGPLVSVLSVALVAFLLFPSPKLLHFGGLWPNWLLFLSQIWLLMFGIMSLLIALATIIPSKTGGFYSDGARFIQLAKGDAGTLAELEFIAIYSQSLAGTRPKALPIAKLEQLAKGPLPELFRLSVYGYNYYHYLDAGQATKAGFWLEQTLGQLEGALPVVVDAMKWEAAWYYTRIDKRPDSASSFVAGPPGDLTPKATIARVKAAMLLASGHKAEAAAQAQAGIAALPNHSDPGLAQWEAEELTTLLALAKQ